jgi:glycopeptide antibiotics resistance protein
MLKGKNLFDDFEISMLSAILITLWPIIPSGNFFNNWLSIIYFLPLGFLLSSLNKKYNFKAKL